MMTINIYTKDSFDVSDNYTFLVDPQSIRREFDYAVHYTEDMPEPFTDEDSNRLFEVISKTEPYISEEFRRIDTYTFHTKYFGTDIISNLAPDIMLALLILRARKYDTRIVIKDYLSCFPMKWLAENYDISVYADIRSVYDNTSLRYDPNIELRYNGEKIEDHFSFFDEHLSFTLKKANDCYKNFARRRLCLTLDEEVSLKDLFGLLKENGAQIYVDETECCNDYTVELPNNTFCFDHINGFHKYPSIFCVTECGSTSSIGRFYSVKNPTILEMITQMIMVFEEKKADRLTAVIGNEILEEFSQDFIKEMEYGIVIDRKRRKLSIMEPNVAAVHFCKAAEKCDIPPEQIPEDIVIEWE